MNRQAQLALGLAIVGLVGLAVLGVSLVGEEPGSSFAENDQGAQALVAAADARDVPTHRLVSSPLALDRDADLASENTVLVVPGADSTYADAEREHVRSLLTAGGTVVVAESLGEAGSLVEPLGLTFERVSMLDPDAGGTFEVTTDGESYDVGLPQPTAINVAEDADPIVLATSSTESFLDRNGNGTIDRAEPHGPFPLVAELPTEDGGRLLLIGDEDALAPSTQSDAENRAWARALLADVTDREDTLVVDESHQSTSDPVVAAVGGAVRAASTPPWSWLVLAAGAASLAGLTAARVDIQRWSPHEANPDRFVTREMLASRNGHADDEEDEASAEQATASDHGSWTRRGQIAMLGGLALALAGLALGNRQATYAAALLLAAVAASTLVPRPRVEVDREVEATRLREDGTIEADLVLEAGATASGLVHVRDELPPEFEHEEGHHWFRVDLSDRDRIETHYEATPRVRGNYEIGSLKARREDPLRLRIHESTVAEPNEVEVAPRGQEARETPFDTRVPTIIQGPHKVNRAGDGSEFQRLRTYQEGDSFRDINWKASARAVGDLFVNEQSHESMTTLTLFLDARWVAGAGPSRHTPLNEGARITMSLVDAALRVRDRVRVIVYGEEIHEIEPGSRDQQMHQLRSVLAEIEPGGDIGFGNVVDEVAPEITPQTPVMLVSGLEGDETLMDGMRELRAREILPVVVACGVHAQDEDERERLEEQRRERLSALRGAKVPVFDASEVTSLDYLFRVGVS